MAEDAALERHDDAPLRERLARLETTVGTATAEVETLRERSHGLSNDMQRLIGEVSGNTRMVERLIGTLATQAEKTGSLSAELTSHVTGCRQENSDARADRLKFRREVRGYMVSIVITVLLYALAGKLNISLSGIGP